MCLFKKDDNIHKSETQQMTIDRYKGTIFKLLEYNAGSMCCHCHCL